MTSIIILASERDLNAAVRLSEAISRKARYDHKVVTSLVNVPGDEQSLVISFSARGEVPEQNLQLQQNGRSWLRLVLHSRPSLSDAGPLFQPGLQPCYQCFQSFFPASSSGELIPVRPLYERFLLEILTMPVLALIKDGEAKRPLRRFEQFDHASLQLAYKRTLSRADCVCRRRSSTNIPRLHSSAPALIFEDLCANDTPTPGGPGEFPARVSNLVRQSLVPILYPSLKKLRLGPIAALPPDGICSLLQEKPQVPRARPTLEELSSIFIYSSGFRLVERKLRNAERFAASGGNLGSSELLLLLESRPNLPRLFRYRPMRHDLVDLDCRAAPAMGQRLLRPGHPAALLFCGMFSRLADKYGPFAFKLMYLDAGVAFSQAALVSKSFGLRLVLDTEIDLQQLSRSSNLPREREVITAVATLHVGDSLGLGHSLLNSDQPFARKPSSEALPNFLLGNIGVEKLISILSQTSKKPSYGRATPLSPLFVPEPCVPGSPSLAEILSHRNSVRIFNPVAPPIQDLLEIALTVDRCDREEWPEEADQNMALRFFLLLRSQNTGLHLHQLDAAAATFVKVADSPFAGLPIYLHPCFEQAPAAFWIVGDLERATASAGASGYRDLFFRAGAAANRLWLASLERKAEGSIVAGLLQHNARTMFGFDGWKELPLCAFVVGRQT
jgi:SagB-type dehydrogenase family enzyme